MIELNKKGKKILFWNTKDIDNKLFNIIPKLVEEIDLSDEKNTNGETLFFSVEEEKIKEALNIIEDIESASLNFLIETEIKTEEKGIWSDLFLEIEEILLYFEKLSEYDRDLMNPREPMNSFYFHKQMSNFIYLFSSLDKITSLIFFHLITFGYQKELEKNKIKTKTKLYFKEHFQKLSKFLLDKEKVEEFNVFFNELFKSPLWEKILYQCRNNWNHNFSHVMNFHNIGFKLILLKCFVIRICAQIKYTFVSSGNSNVSRTFINFCLTK